MFQVKIQYRNEPWDESGRIVLVPRSEAATANYARNHVREMLGHDWKIVSVTDLERTESKATIYNADDLILEANKFVSGRKHDS